MNDFNDMSGNKTVVELITKYLHDTITAEELDELSRHLAQSESNRMLFEKLNDPYAVAAEVKALHDMDVTGAWKKFQSLFLTVIPLPSHDNYS